MALLCEDETKMVTAGLLEPPKLLFLNGLTTMDDNHQCYRVAAPSSSIFLSNADHDFAPPTCMVEVSAILLLLRFTLLLQTLGGYMITLRYNNIFCSGCMSLRSTSYTVYSISILEHVQR